MAGQDLTVGNKTKYRGLISTDQMCDDDDIYR